ncbi:MAG: hypothetical protein ACF8OB_06535, partial [Phycisphaeraceae bacterium JB051]
MHVLQWRILLLIGGLMMTMAISCEAQTTQTSQRVQLSRGNFKVQIDICPDYLIKEFGARFDRTAVVKQVTLND